MAEMRKDSKRNKVINVPGTAGKGKNAIAELAEAEKWRFWWIMKSPCRTWKMAQQKGYMAFW